MKNIAFYCPQIYPCKIGGLEIFTYYLAKEISKNNKVLVFTECKAFSSTGVETVILNSRIFLIKYFFLADLSRFLSIFFYLIRNPKKNYVFHVPHTNSATTLGLIFIPLKLLFKIDYIVILHSGNVKKYKQSLLQKAFMKHAKKIIAVSKESAEDYRILVNRELEIIPSLIPFRKSRETKHNLRKKYKIAEDAKVLIMVGSLKPLKGNKTVTKAFTLLGKNFIEEHNLQLVFAGTGPDKEMLINYSKENDIEVNVKFLGNIKNEDLNEIYALADYYVIASWFESLSKSLLEAMFNGLPIIASNVPVLNRIIRDEYNGLLFEKDNDVELAGKMKFLIENGKTAKMLGENARNNCKAKYDFKKVLKQYEQLYKSI